MKIYAEPSFGYIHLDEVFDVFFEHRFGRVRELEKKAALDADRLGVARPNTVYGRREARVLTLLVKAFEGRQLVALYEHADNSHRAIKNTFWRSSPGDGYEWKWRYFDPAPLDAFGQPFHGKVPYVSKVQFRQWLSKQRTARWVKLGTGSAVNTGTQQIWAPADQGSEPHLSEVNADPTITGVCSRDMTNGNGLVVAMQPMGAGGTNALTRSERLIDRAIQNLWHGHPPDTLQKAEQKYQITAYIRLELNDKHPPSSKTIDRYFKRLEVR